MFSTFNRQNIILITNNVIHVISEVLETFPHVGILSPQPLEVEVQLGKCCKNLIYTTVQLQHTFIKTLFVLLLPMTELRILYIISDSDS